MPNPRCPHCNGASKKAGFTVAGNQQYRCKSCHREFTIAPKPPGRKPKGDRPLTSAERSQRWRSRLTPEQRDAIAKKRRERYERSKKK